MGSSEEIGEDFQGSENFIDNSFMHSLVCQDSQIGRKAWQRLWLGSGGERKESEQKLLATRVQGLNLSEPHWPNLSRAVEALVYAITLSPGLDASLCPSLSVG